MTPCYQLVSHVPSINKFGDCTRACIAAMLDLSPEDVPHFAEFSTNGFNEREYWKRIEEFLDEHSLAWAAAPISGTLDDVLATMEHNNAGIYYILGCQGPAGPHHLVCCGDRIVSDPAGRDRSVYRADESGLNWVVFLVGKRFTESATGPAVPPRHQP